MASYIAKAVPRDLGGQNVLIVEDEHLLAEDLVGAVVQAGGVVIGPVPDVGGALALIKSNHVDAAVLDIRLGDDLSFPIARELREKGIRLVFVSGYDDWYMPDDLAEVEVYQKPADPENVVRILFPPNYRS